MADSIFDERPDPSDLVFDMSDPCQVAPRLEEALNRLLAGEMVVKARFGNDETEWQQSDIGALERRIDKLKAECRARQNPCRSAIPVIYPRYRSGW